MQLPVKVHYATLAMLALASRYRSGKLVTARNIANQQRIPNQFLGQILQQLRTAGLIVSTRGAAGGFKLARDPEQISVAAIVEAICPGPASDLDSTRDDPLHLVVREVWRELSELQLQFLEQLSLAELVQRLTRDPAGIFYI